jgi:hypothetical protein
VRLCLDGPRTIQMDHSAGSLSRVVRRHNFLNLHKYYAHHQRAIVAESVRATCRNGHATCSLGIVRPEGQVVAPGSSMPARPCPQCRVNTPRVLDWASDQAVVWYYRSDRCGGAWSVPRNDPDATPRLVTRPRPDSKENGRDRVPSA